MSRASEPVQVFVDDSGARRTWVRRVARVGAFACGVYGALVFASLFGAGWVPRIGLPGVGVSGRSSQRLLGPGSRETPLPGALIPAGSGVPAKSRATTSTTGVPRGAPAASPAVASGQPTSASAPGSTLPPNAGATTTTPSPPAHGPPTTGPPVSSTTTTTTSLPGASHRRGHGPPSL
jgi:hypothetical protein